MMQHACRQGHRGSRCAQHLAEKLVRKRQLVGLHPIVTGEKPSGQPLADGVQPVTSGVLCTLNQICQQVSLQMARSFPSRSNSFFKRFASMRKPDAAT